MPRLYSIYYTIIIEFLYTSFSVYISKDKVAVLAQIF